jgi:hypothetical protein
LTIDPLNEAIVNKQGPFYQTAEEASKGKEIDSLIHGSIDD